ncbi:uncharacterized protein LOC110115833 [Dendrobium catenatum]|uniref:uncharacterized protein LOC110115833 n=1 Tax=Dendrobium catenatum TaxID=906689 RepID=UPI00109F3850|nr:uncharacterized protein LOC110115833 [Dendrobium catenatum]
MKAATASPLLTGLLFPSIPADRGFYLFQTLTDNQTTQTILKGRTRDGLYILPSTPNFALQTIKSSTSLWHARLGHPHLQLLQLIARKNPTICLSSASTFLCNSCNVAKCHKLPFSLNETKTSAPFTLMHTDVWGPAPLSSLNGYNYYVVFVDDFTRFSWVYPMFTKNETINKLQILINLIQTQFNSKIKNLRSDGGGEYTSREFTKLLNHHGIHHQLTCPYTPEQNGIAERKHRHLIETTRTLLHASNLSLKFWLEALLTANYLINRLPSKTLNFDNPYNLLHGHQPSYNHLKTFGCLCYPWLRPLTPSKLHPRSAACIFLGYSSNHKGYRCFNPTTSKIHISRHVVFHENNFLSQPSHSTTQSPQHSPTHTPLTLIPISTLSHNLPTTTSNSKSSNTSNTTSSPPQQTPSSSQSQTQTISPPLPSLPQPTQHPMITRYKTGSLKPKKHFNLLAATRPSSTPSCFTQASKLLEWRLAMSEEFDALQRQGTWSLVPIPQNHTILGCKWTYRTKLKPDGTIDRYKARLVAQGFKQQYGIDYKETFSPVAKMPTIRILLTVALTKQWPVLQLDVSNAFLHGTLDEDVYMKQPPGFVDTTHPDYVCKLHKTIYGLKQAPRLWFQTLTGFFLSTNFKFSKSDPSLLIYSDRDTHIYVLIYVDDLLISGNNLQKINSLISKLHSQFSIKDLGPISFFLGIQVSHTPNGYFLSQAQYALDILKAAGLSQCKPASTPIAVKGSSTNSVASNFDPVTYRKLAGSLQYLTITRPDIAFATNMVCQNMHQPTDQSQAILKRLLRYINGTIHFGLPITRGNLQLTSFSDSDWASDTSDRRSITGYCTFLGNTLVSWCVKKQPTVAKSSTEAEYRSLASATSDIIWLRRLLAEFQVSVSSPTSLSCDNISALALANNPVFHARTKHIEIDYHFIRDRILSNEISVHHISSLDQPADLLTKPLSTSRFQMLCNKLTITSHES